jgi:glycerol-3-phosphate dehydrogenase
MAAVTSAFPSLNIQLVDVIATIAGVRPVIGTGKADPSEESREHVLWQEAGLVTVTGGKLTTFRLIAHDALKAIRERFPDWPPVDERAPALMGVSADALIGLGLDERLRRRLVGRYGSAAPALAAAALADEWEQIPGTHFIWAELRWAARAEGVQHLEDLLLRRTRVGLLLPKGGQAHLPRVRAICQPELGWDDGRWQMEEQAYLALWQRCYSLPPPESIPDWNAMLVEAESAVTITTRRPYQRRLAAAILLALALALAAVWLWQKSKEQESS